MHFFADQSVAPISWAVSQNSTEAEIVSLDTGLRMDGLFAFILWDTDDYVL